MTYFRNTKFFMALPIKYTSLRYFLIPLLLGACFFLEEAFALNCYICAEGGLEEFGECKTSFPFNCDAYGKRFAPNEKIYCRTTRHKTFNGSYTVVKECIAESAHYATFPHKSQQLEEECDVLDVNGFEVAYCICRNADLCNGAAIVDQFTEFENKYPELFDPVPASDEGTATGNEKDENGGNNENEQDENGEGDNDGTKGQGQRQQGERRGRPTTTSTFLQSGQTNHNEHNRQLGQSNQQQQNEEEEEDEQQQDLTDDQQQRLRLPQWTPQNPFVAPPPDQIGAQENLKPTGPSSFRTSTPDDEMDFAPSVPTTSSSVPMLPTSTLARPKSPERPTTVEMTGTGTQLGLLPELQCMQCSESNLADSGADCGTQIVVSCPDQSKQAGGIGRPLCMTRQTHQNGNGENYSIEKLCVTERAILNEFGGKKAADLLNGANRDEAACLEQHGDANAKGTNQRICICSSAQCNQPTLAEQIAYGRTLISQPNPEINFGPPPPFAPPASPNTKPALLEVNSPALEVEALNCAVCLDVELSNPKADCRNVRTLNCAHEIKNEKAFCLTRQTQNGRDAWIVEKSCVSKLQFYQQFPEELEKHSDRDVPIGCASTYNSYVNYCICDGQMCNRNSIAQQAESMGSKNKLPFVSSTPLSSVTEPKSTTADQQQFNGKLQKSNGGGIGTKMTTNSSPSPKNTGATSAGGGAWHQDDENEQFGTAKFTNKRPAPANLSPTSSVQWVTTTTPIPPSSSASSTSPSSILATSSSSSSPVSATSRDRMEKWKASMHNPTSSPTAGGDASKKSGGTGTNTGRKRPKDIFDEYDQQDGANSAFPKSAGTNYAGAFMTAAAAIFLLGAI